jgi:hypothetical protein
MRSAVLTFNHCVLQFNVADRDAKLILSSTRDTATKEPLNRVARRMRWKASRTFPSRIFRAF